MENLGFSKDKYVFSSMPSMFLIGDTAEDIRKKTDIFIYKWIKLI